MVSAHEFHPSPELQVICMDIAQCTQTSEKQMISREVGQEKASDASDSVIYKIEVPANRSVDTERALLYHYLRVR